MWASVEGSLEQLRTGKGQENLQEPEESSGQENPPKRLDKRYHKGSLPPFPSMLRTADWIKPKSLQGLPKYNQKTSTA